MQTVFDLYLSGRLAQDRHRQLLRQAEEERRARKGEGNGKPEMPLDLAKSLQERAAAERLGRQLGRIIYCCYSELLDRGLPQERAIELTKDLIGQLAGDGLDFRTMLCYHQGGERRWRRS